MNMWREIVRKGMHKRRKYAVHNLLQGYLLQNTHNVPKRERAKEREQQQWDILEIKWICVTDKFGFVVHSNFVVQLALRNINTLDMSYSTKLYVKKYNVICVTPRRRCNRCYESNKMKKLSRDLLYSSSLGNEQLLCVSSRAEGESSAKCSTPVNVKNEYGLSLERFIWPLVAIERSPSGWTTTHHC